MMPNNPKIQSFLRARILRRNLTSAEKTLWTRLRGHRLAEVGFRRQHPIGPYIVDFCAPRRKIIIELDGSHHVHQQEYDSIRTVFLQERGFTVLRFVNSKVETDIEWVLMVIRDILDPEETE